MADWKEYTVADVISTVIDYRGKTPKKLGGDWSDSGYRALSAKNIKTGKIVQPDSIRYVSEDMYRCWMKEEVQKEDILITSEAPFGQIYYWDSDEKIVLSQRLFAVRINQRFYPKYIYFYMTSSFFQAELDGRATGTTVVGLRQPELLKCKIFAPNYQEQKRIADTLWCLEQKINNNEAINNNLQQQAQAIYRDWFVVCTPFGGTPPSTWSRGKLKDVLQLQKNAIKAGAAPELPYLPIDTIPMKTFAVSDFRPNAEAQSSLIRFNKDDILIGAMRVYFHRVIIAPCDGITRTTCFVLKPIDYAYLSFGLLTCDLDSSIDHAQNTSKGSTMPYAVWDGGMGEIEIAIPPIEVAEQFNAVVLPMLRQIQNSYFEVKALRELRDNLLPRLMSGELDISNLT